MLEGKAALTPCFWMATLVRWTNMLSSSLVLGVYFTVQKRQKPSLYLSGNSDQFNALRKSIEKYNTSALPGVAQWIECWTVNQRVTGSIPSQGTCLSCGPRFQ